MRLPYLMLLALCSCSPPEATLRSEIGDGALRPAKVYPDEEISITLWEARGDPPDQITIVIKPDQSMRVERYDVNRSKERSELITHTLDTEQVSEQLFDELRTRLSVYRPQELAKDGPMIFPRGCGFISHSQGVINVGFEDANGKSGYFVLQEACVGASAARTKADLEDILSKMPELDGTEGYGWRRS